MESGQKYLQQLFVTVQVHLKSVDKADLKKKQKEPQIDSLVD